jgi:hypothetical protein
MKKMKSTLLTLAAILAALPVIHGATIVSATFNSVTNGAVSTTGLADWGYVNVDRPVNQGLFHGATAAYNNLAYNLVNDVNSSVITATSATPTVGTVTLREGNNTDTLGGQQGTGSYTFGGNAAFGLYGGLAASEANVWNMTFNNLGIGTYDIVLYMGHTADNRSFKMDALLTDGLTNPTDSETSGVISALGSTVAFGAGDAFTYNIRVTTTAATDDLSLTFSSVSGSTGGALFSGYTVAAIPEPASALLGGLGMLALLRRRRA